MHLKYPLPTFLLPVFLLIYTAHSHLARQDIPTVNLLQGSDVDPALDVLVWRYVGNTSTGAAEHFGHLQLDGTFLLVASADSFHNLSLSDFQPVNIFKWEPTEAQHRDCLMKSMEEELCRNYIRVLTRISQDRLLVCGTNAFSPACRLLDSNKWETVSEMPGIGLIPPSPRQNGTYLLATASEDIYSASVTDFAGEDPLLFRRRVTDARDMGLRTQRGNNLQLERPQFISMVQSEQYVYLFFREEAVEAESAASFSRVARICKADRGGPKHYSHEWTTFVKARLNCSIHSSHGRPFFFNNLMAVSGLHNGTVYASFASEFDFLATSVICSFRLADIDAIFDSGQYLAFDPAQRRWTRRSRDEQTARLGHCNNAANVLTEDEALMKRKFPLMADAVPNLLPGGAAGIYQSSDRYSQIAVLSNVQHDAGSSDVLYVATEQGNVLKMLVRPPMMANGTGSSHHQQQSATAADSLLHVATFQISHLPIRRLLIVPALRALIVATDGVVYRLPLHFCHLHASCMACLGSRDPHCVWHDAECRGREEEAETGKKLTKRVQQQMVQDVLGRKGLKICAGFEEQPKKETANKQENAIFAEPLRKDLLNRTAQHYEVFRPTTKFGGSDNGNCECAASVAGEEKLAKKCDCIGAFGPGQLFPPKSWKEPSEKLWSDQLRALPWWVLLLIVLAAMQSLAFLWLCLRYFNRHKPFGSSAGSETAKSPVGSGLISAYSPEASSAFHHHQSDHWTLSTAASASSNRSSSTSSSPKGSSTEFAAAQIRGVVGNNVAFRSTTAGSSFLQGGWSLLAPARRTSAENAGEINVQLEGGSVATIGPSPYDGMNSAAIGTMTLPFYSPPMHQRQSNTPFTLRR